MRQAGDRYVVLATAADTAIYFCNSLGVITGYNNLAAEFWGRRPALDATDERFCGSHMLYRADGNYLPHDQCPMADVLAGKVPGIYDAEVQIQRPDGSRVVVVVNVAPLIDDDGAIVGAVNSFHENPMGAK